MKFSKPYTIAELTALMPVQPRLIGKADIRLTGMNEIHMVEPGDVTFVDAEKYYDMVLNSAADVILINKEVVCPEGKCLLVTEDPLSCFNALTRHFRPFEPCPSAISPTAEIGKGTVIQPNVFVGNHVKIGKNCIIHANVSIYDHTVIGDNVIIQSNSVIGGDAYYFKHDTCDTLRRIDSCGRTVLEDDVEIGALCAIDKGVTGDTIIGQGTKLDNFVQIGHDTHIGKHCLVGAHCAVAGVTTLGDHVILWADVMVNKDLVLEDGTVVLATSAVDKSLTKGVYFGTPAIEARKKWKEMAAMRMLPDMMEKIKHLL
ncbi:MAG: UDP-3-O-(3-hydroxymyristoyl)glucosamine N-acyltransferase [Bacteroidales bacterium]|nr:UDP-3-O-(3-hydroxymyristoyl)glucosamine N-acyltransferase [Bacteroidales bacterium]